MKAHQLIIMLGGIYAYVSFFVTYSGFVENIVHQADTRDISLHVYPKAKHWLHHEVLPERTDYLHDLVDWLVTQSEETNSCHQIV